MKELLYSLPDRQLEDMWSDCQVSGDHDLSDMVVSVLMERPLFSPQTYDLLWELQDAGWNGGCSDEDRLSR